MILHRKYIAALHMANYIVMQVYKEGYFSFQNSGHLVQKETAFSLNVKGGPHREKIIKLQPSKLHLLHFSVKKS